MNERVSLSRLALLSKTTIVSVVGDSVVGCAQWRTIDTAFEEEIEPSSIASSSFFVNIVNSVV